MLLFLRQPGGQPCSPCLKSYMADSDGEQGSARRSGFFVDGCQSLIKLTQIYFTPWIPELVLIFYIIRGSFQKWKITVSRFIQTLISLLIFPSLVLHAPGL